MVHVVREGETLWDIESAYGVSVEAIMQASGLDEREALTSTISCAESSLCVAAAAAGHGRAAAGLTAA